MHIFKFPTILTQHANMVIMLFGKWKLGNGECNMENGLAI